METIEERAKNLDTRKYESLAMKADSSYEFGYMVGATEQKAIDIDKACAWLKARNVLTDASLEGFRKAMTE